MSPFQPVIIANRQVAAKEPQHISKCEKYASVTFTCFNSYHFLKTIIWFAVESWVICEVSAL